MDAGWTDVMFLSATPPEKRFLQCLSPIAGSSHFDCRFARCTYQLLDSSIGRWVQHGAATPRPTPCGALHACKGQAWRAGTGDSCPVFGVVTKASMLAEFFFALAMLWWEGLRALKIDISS